MSFDVQGQGFGKSPGGGFGKNGGGFGAGGQGFSGNNPEDDPLKDTKYTGYLDEDLAEQLSELQKGFKDRTKKENERRKRAMDGSYWFAVCFETYEQKKAFLNAMKLFPKVYGDLYIDGKKWARQENIDLPD
ncbi:hypothetical protein QPX34_07025 [Corynebacterium accolens]|uniref:Cell division protein SepF n=1 Tax=Corynebacterium accolens TaxID=38284 RepID=A0ABT7FQS9_9CORY|nr:hypothetical protein [Corynebacterium accolens]MDK4247777.1 hypothetical protein [Corynebacterium accolens]DAX96087.1 MAG TPA: hypothetical protein [Caudoviricetes sp.]